MDSTRKAARLRLDKMESAKDDGRIVASARVAVAVAAAAKRATFHDKARAKAKAVFYLCSIQLRAKKEQAQTGRLLVMGYWTTQTPSLAIVLRWHPVSHQLPTWPG